MPPKRRTRIIPNDASTRLEEATRSDRTRPERQTARSGGFLFVASTGQKRQPSDQRQLRTLRAHVMQNYLDRTHSKQRQLPAEEADEDDEIDHPLTGRQRPGGHDRSTSMTEGQKMRFRLKPDGLEQRYPLNQRKGSQRATKQQQQQPEQFESTSSTSMSTSSRAPQHGQKKMDDVTQQEFIPGLPLTWLGSQRIDPFGVLPVRFGTKEEASIINFRRMERYPWCPINGQSSWSGFAMSDQLVFHATLFSWGMHFRARAGAVSPPDPEEEMQVMQHKLAAVKLINDRLSDLEQAASDETIAAVAALANIALVVDSFSEARKHMQGLDAIVRMRGGLSSLGESGVQQHLQRLISWNDLIYSEVFDETLRFPPIKVWDEAWGSFQHPRLLGSLPGLSPQELRKARVAHHPDVVDLLENIRELCWAEQVTPLSRTDEPSRMRRGDMFLRIERRLRLIAQEDEYTRAHQQDDGHWDARVWRAVALAALVYTHHNLRGNPSKYRHFGVLTIRLHDVLLAMDEGLSEFEFAPAMLIWMLHTGVTLSRRASVHGSFVSMLERACRRFGLLDRERFRWTLAGFLWTGEADERRCLASWQEVEQVQTSMQVR
ncbi:hypothetical protein A1O1_04180 [Capronia coronata CBS 617.96]|uniref:Uncharacterized protein n=1 Tax=Capronia coronata CBS 617.96 TaxID=1182541 RepID=W9YEV1_9EURO|nr:uncharacterized protein A1O1_04180 [Capronia coronata CBS 617.96]EXJ91073.1 hypothetical protein A1O1_04180 [Capronia coronata CBS 617.96]